MELKLVKLAIKSYQEFQSDHPDHLLKATSQGEIYFLFFNLFLRFLTEGTKNVCDLPYSISVKKYRTVLK